MKRSIKILIAIVLLVVGYTGNAQESRNLQFFRPAGADGLNIFETPKSDTVEYKGIKIRMGGDCVIQYQAVDQQIALDGLVELGSNSNLPTANLDIDVQLYDGVRMHLRTFLSASDHQETWVKGGYI